ncbi:hypothetical protein GCM10009117_08730 [Gangjinia marincola]|uniref:dTDP-4-dehydrorhamnose reductase n=1 Tax=Gangjinia marincola TaxID=578463 RepID=A0ABN1MF27_9FLAO
MSQKKKKILILGGSGFIGNALYKELYAYFDTYATYFNTDRGLSKNHKFIQWDLETEDIGIMLQSIRPSIIISCLRGDFDALVHQHQSLIQYTLRYDAKIIFLSSANVFDAFSNFPSYEYDKTLSESVYGRFKIKIENALLRLPNKNYAIVRLPMVFGKKSPRIEEIKEYIKNEVPIEVFPNVVVNATTISKITQQLHYIINRSRRGVFHLGSDDLIHHDDLILDICQASGHDQPILKNVFDSNDDRYLAVIPKDNILPKNYHISIKEVVEESVF